MSNNYTDHIKQIILCTKEEASRFQNRALRPEHFMLGILSDGQGKAILALRRQGVDLEALRDRLLQALTNVDNEPIADDQQQQTVYGPITKESYRALTLSSLEARMMRQPEVDAEHLILAMLKDNESNVSRLLLQYHVDYDSFHETLKNINEPATGEVVKVKIDIPIQDFSRKEEDEDAEDEEENNELEDAYTPRSEAHLGTGSVKIENSDNDTPTLDRFGFDLTEAARQGRLDPVVGREKEIERLAQILSRRKKNNPILLGDPGVGKTAIVEGLAQRIVSKEVSFLLKNKRIVSLDLAGLVAGTKYRGQFEERLKGIMREVCGHPEIILYIDEIHTMVGAGNAQGSMDAANMLKPALSRGEMQCIGSTTLDEFRKSIEKDGALDRRFQKVLVEPTSAADTLAILSNLRDRYEEHHHVRYTEDALQACVTLSDRYISDRSFPDKAIDILDEAGSRMHLRSAQPAELQQGDELEEQLKEARRNKDEALLSMDYEQAATFRDQERQLEEKIREQQKSLEESDRDSAPAIDADTIADVVAQMTGIPVQKVASSEGQKLLHLKETLQSHVIGQDEAIQKVVRSVQRTRLGLKDPKRPIGTFLFLGPTGVGKTYLAKKIAEELFATPDSLIRIDMSEFMEKYSTSRLIGAAPGYIGYEEGGQLTERVRRRPYSVILFDEIEKADREVFNLLLQLFDEGHLTDATGRKVDFKNCIIILTSNVGSRQLGDFGTGIGFQDFSEAQKQSANDAVIRKELKKTFSPEFLNRIDDIISFRQLTQPDIRRIVEVELKPVLARIEALGYEVEVTEAMKDFLAEKGYDPKYGARPLRRAIEQYIEDQLCDRLLSAEPVAAESARPHLLLDKPE